MSSKVDGDLFVTGTLVVSTGFVPPAASIGNAAFTISDPLAANKCGQQRAIPKTLCDHGVDAATKRTHVYTVQGTGTLLKFSAVCSTVAGAATTLTIQLKKNGSSILSAAIVLDNGNTNFVSEDAAGFTSASVVAGDVLEADATLAGTNEPQGVSVTLVLNEVASS